MGSRDFPCSSRETEACWADALFTLPLVLVVEFGPGRVPRGLRVPVVDEDRACLNLSKYPLKKGVTSALFIKPNS